MGTEGDARVVDENVELAASQLRHLRLALVDARLLVDVEANGRHAHVAEAIEDFRAASSRNDMVSWEGVSGCGDGCFRGEGVVPEAWN